MKDPDTKCHILYEFCLYEMSRIRKPIVTESKLVVAGGGRGEECRVTANRHRVSFWSDENVLELVVTAAQLCEYSENH